MPRHNHASRRRQFQKPGGPSAVRAARPGSPRHRPCPTCKTKNRLTPAEEQRGDQCDGCLRADECVGG